MRKFTIAIIAAATSLIPFALGAQEPGALDVEWQGKKPCENLYEDDQIRILRCTLPPGAKHVRHRHPANFVYTLSGGKLEVTDATGTQRAEAVTDAAALSPPIAWHEGTNIGDTTVRYVVVEMKYRKQ